MFHKHITYTYNRKGQKRTTRRAHITHYKMEMYAVLQKKKEK